MDDPDYEEDESVEITLSAGSYTIVNTGKAVIKIQDDDPLPLVGRPAGGGCSCKSVRGQGTDRGLVLVAALALLISLQSLSRRRQSS